jgi:hypothetical protein
VGPRRRGPTRRMPGPSGSSVPSSGPPVSGPSVPVSVSVPEELSTLTEARVPWPLTELMDIGSPAGALETATSPLSERPCEKLRENFISRPDTRNMPSIP